MALQQRAIKIRAPLDGSPAALAQAFNAIFDVAGGMFQIQDILLQESNGTLAATVIYEEASGPDAQGLRLVMEVLPVEGASDAFLAQYVAGSDLVPMMIRSVGKTLFVVQARAVRPGLLGLVGRSGVWFMAEAILQIPVGMAGAAIVRGGDGSMYGTIQVINIGSAAWPAGARGPVAYGRTSGGYVGAAWLCGGVAVPLVPDPEPPLPPNFVQCVTKEVPSKTPVLP